MARRLKPFKARQINLSRSLTCLLAILGLILMIVAPALAQAPFVYRIAIKGPITPVTAAYLDRAITTAEEEGAVGLIVELDTPGGLGAAMEEMVKRILAARVPVVVYVSPSGGRAGSAGVFITLAAHIAAMAPNTRIGAAHPVGPEGQDLPATMAQKVTADMLASIRNLAERRGEKAKEWAEKAVRESASATEKEALELGVIDLVSPSFDALLADLDGRSVTIGGSRITLRTRGAALRDLPMTVGESFLFWLTDPNIAYILLILGINGLIFELSNPGAILPGVAGGICLLLALYSLGTLPLNYAGLALIALAFILFVLEVKVTSHGLLTAGGVIALFLGSLMLTSGAAPYFTISPLVIVTVVGSTTLFFLFVVGKAIMAQRRQAVTGREGLVGAVGLAKSPLAPDGVVMVQGELWEASSEGERIEAGERVRVIKVEGLRLTVKALSKGTGRPP